MNITNPSRRKLVWMMIGLILGSCLMAPAQSQRSETWVDKPQKEWPQITMINQIEYVDKKFPIAACSFLLDAGKDIFAVTAKPCPDLL